MLEKIIKILWVVVISGTILGLGKSFHFLPELDLFSFAVGGILIYIIRGIEDDK